MNDLTPLTIESATKAKMDFLALLEGSGAVRIDLAAVDCLDLAGLQLLVSVLREAEARKREIHFSGALSEGFRHFIMLSGTTEDGCRTGDQFELDLKAVY